MKKNLILLLFHHHFNIVRRNFNLNSKNDVLVHLNENCNQFNHCEKSVWRPVHSLHSDLHSNRPHARSSSTMRDAERLVQVEMRHVRAIISGTTQTHLENRKIYCVRATVAGKVIYQGYLSGLQPRITFTINSYKVQFRRKADF